MAAVLGFERPAEAPCAVPSEAEAAAAFDVVLRRIGGLPVADAVAAVAGYRCGLDAVEARVLASVVTDGGDTRAAERIAGRGGKRSKRSRGRLGRRAAAVKKNKALADKMGSGELSGEQLDVLAAAAKRTEGESLTNEALIDEVASVNPDLGKGVIDEFLAKNRTADEVQTRHDRQRSKRRVSRFVTKDDLDAILFAGDRATIDRIWKHATRGANDLYRADGGRDVASGQHPRTFDQRMFDSLTGMIGGNAGPGAGTAAGHAAASGTTDTVGRGAANEQGATGDRGDTADRDGTGDTVRTGDGISESSGGEGQSSATASSVTPAGKPRRPSKRCTPKVTTTVPTIVVGVTLAKLAGLAPSQAAELIGTGPIADSVLAEYLAADANLVGAVFGAAGQPLWLGRNARLASQAQITALIVRDKHCVLCGADHTRCVAHHLMPWNAPARGETDIEKLALVCEPCHRRLHDEKQTLYQDRRTRRWKLRPALAHEIPPSRPPDPNRGQAPQRT